MNQWTILRCWFTGEAGDKTSDRAFAIAAATTWNRLPPQVRTATSTEQFSRALKTHLFTLDWSRASPRRLWLVISTDELWRCIQIEWLIDWLMNVACSCSEIAHITFNMCVKVEKNTDSLWTGQRVTWGHRSCSCCLCVCLATSCVYCVSWYQLCSADVPAWVCTATGSETRWQTLQSTYCQHTAARPRRHADESTYLC